MSLPLAVVLDQLKTTPESIIPILSALHEARSTFAGVSKVDLKHLASRTLNFCRYNDTYTVWCGVNIVHVLADSSELVGSEGSAFFAQILKVLGSAHAQNGAVLESAIQCLCRLCDNIRGKPTLTREILTPNLGSIFAVLLEKLPVCPTLVLSSLQKLVQEHPTTSRPYANKLKTQLLKMVMEPHFLNYPSSLRTQACSALACLPVIEKDAPEDHWLRDVHALVAEITSTVDIYSSFLNVQEDQETSALFKALGGAAAEGLFPPLSIDINRPDTIFAISQRVQVLFELLQGYLLSGTRFSVCVPLGKVLGVADLVCSLNTRFVAFKREIRDAEVKQYIELSLTRCHVAALALLRQLPAQFSASLVPHVTSVLATLESLVFLQHKRLDHAKVLAHEHMMCEIVACATKYLGLQGFFSDHSSVSRVLEAAIFLVQPRVAASAAVDEASKVKLSQQSKSARKRTKRNAAVPLSDLISHEHLFRSSVAAHTRKTVLVFFACVIRRVPISSTHYNKILKHVIIEAVKQAGTSKHNHVSAELEEVLVAASLHPAPESASIFPIAHAILPNSDTLGVLSAPRLPPLSVLIKNMASAEDEDDDEDEDDERQVGQFQGQVESQPLAKKFKTGSAASEEEENGHFNVTKKPATEVEERDIFKTKPTQVFEKNTQIVVEPEMNAHKPNEGAVVETVQTTETVSETKEIAEEEMESDSGSEIEIPDLDLEDDSDEEK